MDLSERDKQRLREYFSQHKTQEMMQLAMNEVTSAFPASLPPDPAAIISRFFAHHCLPPSVERLEALEVFGAGGVPTLQINVTATSRGIPGQLVGSSTAPPPPRGAVPPPMSIQSQIDLLEKQVFPTLAGRDLLDSVTLDQHIGSLCGELGLPKSASMCLSMALAKGGAALSDVPLFHHVMTRLAQAKARPQPSTDSPRVPDLQIEALPPPARPATAPSPTPPAAAPSPEPAAPAPGPPASPPKPTAKPGAGRPPASPSPAPAAPAPPPPPAHQLKLIPGARRLPREGEPIARLPALCCAPLVMLGRAAVDLTPLAMQHLSVAAGPLPPIPVAPGHPLLAGLPVPPLPTATAKAGAGAKRAATPQTGARPGTASGTPAAATAAAAAAAEAHQQQAGAAESALHRQVAALGALGEQLGRILQEAKGAPAGAGRPVLSAAAYGPAVNNLEEALSLAEQAAAGAGVAPAELRLLLNCGAEAFALGERYDPESTGKGLASDDLVGFYANALQAHPALAALQGPFAPGDGSAWQKAGLHWAKRILLGLDPVPILRMGQAAPTSPLVAGQPQPNTVFLSAGAYATISDAYLAATALQMAQKARFEAARAEIDRVAADRARAAREREEAEARARQEAEAQAAQEAAAAAEAKPPAKAAGRPATPNKGKAAAKAPAGKPPKGVVDPDAERLAQEQQDNERLQQLEAIPPELLVAWVLDPACSDPGEVDLGVALGAAVMQGGLPLVAPSAAKWNRLLEIERERAAVKARIEERQKTVAQRASSRG
ncbi:hypothetical protein PAPYR_2746 [Paratrimastix pyriformis]|uniref:Enolase N-terminal domain-containing protein n=1 Tax=Paratrimastix pyriformis TaxID=342808 RepID=A0ABQ8UNZ2_9EUKA|nr:hypothetical protein PAPYR_2746 [Paratrimastix pyriformis]